MATCCAGTGTCGAATLRSSRNAREEAAVAGGEADAQAGQVRALGQRVEHDDVGEVGAGRFQHAGGRVLAVDLAVAFVGEHQEAVAARERGEPCRDRRASATAPCGFDGEAMIEGDGAREQRVVERVEIGQEAGRARRRQIDRLAIGRQRAGAE